MPDVIDELTKTVEEIEADTQVQGACLKIEDIMEAAKGELIQPMYYAIKDAPKLDQEKGPDWKLVIIGAISRVTLGNPDQGKREACERLIRKLNDLYPLFDIKGVLGIGSMNLAIHDLAMPHMAFAMIGVTPESEEKLRPFSADMNNLERNW